MWNYYNVVMREVMGFTMTDWYVFSAVCVVLGVLCMRGFGSRKSY